MADERTDGLNLFLLYMDEQHLSEQRLLELDKCNRCGPFFRFNSERKPGVSGERQLQDEIYLMNRMFENNHHRNCKVFNSGKQREGNGAPTGPFAFTLTKSPKDPYSIGDMLTAVRKLMNQKSCPVTKYAWFFEDKGRDENGDSIHPHIHGLYETSSQGRIEAKHFKRAWPIWDEKRPMGAGFRGGYHRRVKDEESYQDYIKKDGGMSECKISDTIV